jgi:Cell cycle protein
MTIGIMPITGLPLPFISYGGSAIFADMIAIGLIQSIRRHHPPPLSLLCRLILCAWDAWDAWGRWVAVVLPPRVGPAPRRPNRRPPAPAPACRLRN